MKEINSTIIEKLSDMSEQELLATSDDGRIFTVLSPDRINAFSWYPYRKSDHVLVAGGSVSSLLLLAGGVSSLSVYTKDYTEAELARRRYPDLIENGKVQILSRRPEGLFDVIINLLGLSEDFTDCLRPGGTMISAYENSGAMTLLTGSGREEDKAYISAEELLSLKADARFTASRVYYPLPNLSFAKNIKSEKLLPAKGDFRGISDTFTGTRAVSCNDEAIYDSLVEADPALIERYAPSYLLVQEGFCPDGEKAGILPSLPDYIRYNRQRKPEFRIRTELTAGKKCVKAALSCEADDHIAAFADKYELLRNTVSPELTVLRPFITTDAAGRKAAVFDFVKGESIGKILAKKIADGKAPEEEVKKYLSLLTDGDECHNLDILFDNCIVSDGTYTLIDYEWVFTASVPKDFVRYRILRYFYEDNKESLTAYGNLDEFLLAFGVEKDSLASSEEQEEEFQLYVHGNDKGGFENRFRVPVKSAAEVFAMERSLTRMGRLEEEVSELKTTLSKEREVERLSQQHIHNIESIVKAREEELRAQSEELTYLRKHESVLSRIRRRVIGRIDRWAPAGSRNRMIIKYVKGTILHPGTYLKRYFTKEGKLLKEGDFTIGGEFPEGGILRLPVTDAPLVSIVIPVYNQVQYTYACIRSILLNTDPEETPYEVILADDASTDATEKITNWIENLAVRKTSGNCGFLRNCNQAASAARGQYIFFLNNDTKVTSGWLSSLCSLMERDETIGMCGSKLIYPDGRLQEAGGIIWSDASGWNYGRLDDPAKPEYNYVKDVDYISGAAILIRRALWEEIGGFDERYAPAYCEDSDLAFEVRRHGKRVVFQPESVVIHFEGVSNGTDVNGQGLKRYQVVNQDKFREKWAEELKKQSENTGNPNPFAARERSQQKKTILVVDHYVPERDRDAGSKTTYQYLKMFTEKGYQVKFLPDNFLYKEPYTKELEQLGIEVLYGDTLRGSIFNWLEKNKEYIDIAYLNRPHIAVKYIDWLKENTNIRIIFYGHDLHYLRIRREYELTGDINKRRESDYWKSVEFSVMEKADMVYYPSQDEIDAIHKENPDIPAKAITAYIYDKEDDGPKEDDSYEKREGLLFVGGFRHPPNEDGVLWFSEEIWPKIHAELPDVHFLVAGSHPTEKVEALNGKDNIDILGFVSDEKLRELYHTTRLTVVPLRYGAGVKGKVIEALNENSVIVTTPVGAEGIPEAGSVMRIARSPEKFAEEVVKLYRDPADIAAKSRLCDPFIRRYYSTDAVWSGVQNDFS